MNVMYRPQWITGMLLIVGLSATMSGSAAAQRGSNSDDGCDGQNWGDDRRGFCEVREYTVPAAGAVLTVDAAPNGGIVVEGSPRGDVSVRARVTATARTEEEARAIAARVQVTATAERITADGPRGLGDREGWHVSYRLAVPPATPLSLHTTNGGISVDGVDSRVDFTTVNGGVKLSRMGGDVAGRTSNGGVDVDLDGSTWHGGGLDVRTTNGGVKLRIPDGYSAHLETATVNGGVNIDYPIPAQERTGRSISADIGGGGPTLRVSTSTGGLRVTRK
jgi:putative adhesin